MSRSPEGRSSDPSLYRRPTQTVSYSGREYGSEYVYIYSKEVEQFLFASSDKRLRQAGLSQSAQRNWMHAIPRGVLPSLDAEGNAAQFQSFHHFEDYVHNFYQTAIRDGKIARRKFKG